MKRALAGLMPLVACAGPRGPVTDERGAADAHAIAAAPSATTPPARAPSAPAPARTDEAADEAADATAAPTPPAPVVAPRVELTFAGDVMFGRFVDGGFAAILAERHDPFVDVAPLLDSDLAMVNLETPVMRAPPTKSPHGTRMRFVTTPARLATLPRAGVDVVTIANNHWYDMRGDGVAETPVLVAEAGMRVVGTVRAPSAPRFTVDTFDVRGWRVGVIAATAVNNTADRPGQPEPPVAEPPVLTRAIGQLVRSARATHDLLVITVHWGVEYQEAPERWRVDAARAWIDAGADAVIGHHPHVLQGIERHGRGVIAYSLGNFLFDNTIAIKRDTGVLRLGFSSTTAGPCLDALRFHPAVIVRDDVFRPVPARAAGATTRVTGRLATLSNTAPLATPLVRDGDDLVGPVDCPRGAVTR
ncbi:MAG: CapA family protein [Kofleriaceae bacterium]